MKLCGLALAAMMLFLPSHGAAAADEPMSHVELALPVAMASAASWQDNIFVFGGSTDIAAHRMTDAIQNIRGGTGEVRVAEARLPVAAAQPAVAATGATAWGFGGISGMGTYTDAAWEYDMTSGAIRSLPPLPAPRGAAVAIARSDGSVLIVGGYAPCNSGCPKPASGALIFDPVSRIYSPAEPPSPALAEAVAVDLAGDVTLVGGFEFDGSRKGPTDSVWQLQGATWDKTAQLPEKRIGSSVVLREGRLLVIGGLSLEAEAQEHALVLDAVTFQRAGDDIALPEPRAYAALAHLNGTAWLAGGLGCDSPSSPCDDVLIIGPNQPQIQKKGVGAAGPVAVAAALALGALSKKKR